MSTAWTFNRAQLQAALDRFIGDGPAVTRAQRQAEADGALMVLDSDAFQKLRVPHNPVPIGAGEPSGGGGEGRPANWKGF